MGTRDAMTVNRNDEVVLVVIWGRILPDLMIHTATCVTQMSFKKIEVETKQ